LSDEQKIEVNKSFWQSWLDRLSAPFRPPSIEEKVLDVSTAKGTFWRQTTEPGKRKYDVSNLTDYFDAYYNSDLIRAPVDDLQESSFGSGYYNSVQIPEGQTASDMRSPYFKAKVAVDKFGEWFNLDAYLVNIGKLTMIAGFCGVETILAKGKDLEETLEKSKLKIIHPLSIAQKEGIETDALTGQVLKVHQKVGSDTNTIEHLGWNTNRTIYKGIAWFTYGKMGTDPRGTSYVRGMIELLNTIRRVTDDVDKILERYIGPLGIWTHTGDIDNIKAAVMNRNQGEDIFISNMDAEERENLVEFLQIDPRVPYWQYIEYLDRRIYAYSRANNPWYVRNATEASATKLEDIVGRHITSIQREAKRAVEGEWYAPIVELVGITIPENPRMNFGLEPTGVEDVQIEQIVVKGIELGYIDGPQYFDLLRQLGMTLKLPQEQEVGGPEDKEEPPEEEP